jgi:hypothetical protein
MTDHLPYTVPKRVPVWVLGFSKYLLNEVRVDDPDVVTLHDTWIRYEPNYWKQYHERGKPRKPRKKADAPSGSGDGPGGLDADGGDGPGGLDGEGEPDGGEPPAKKTRLDSRVRSKWRRRFERLRAIAREHAIAALETEVNDMERDLDAE